ncbi:MAG: hypothetical protein LM564_03190 [Desulfurococcaceae archaeon]|nr:hypothetical protein [Desulfurococcaceae archaeon]
MRSDPSTFTRDWALRWVRGSVESYLLGRTNLAEEKALQRRLSRSETHRLFLEEHIVGIDVMQFAISLNKW